MKFLRKVRLSRHARNRWNNRVGLKSWSSAQIADYLYRRLIPRLRQGINTYQVDGNVYYILNAGRLNNRLTFAVITPDNKGLWAGWRVVTFLTDQEIDDISDYFKWVEERARRGGKT